MNASECAAGLLPHVSEGRGESQPAAHSPEFQSHNLRGGAAPNGLPQNGAAARANAHALEHHAQSHRAREGGAEHVHRNGHVARTEGALGVHDVLSGEDSAPDTGRAVTSPAPGSTPGVPSCPLSLPAYNRLGRDPLLYGEPRPFDFCCNLRAQACQFS